jgi:hypothetical protein
MIFPAWLGKCPHVFLFLFKKQAFWSFYLNFLYFLITNLILR